MLADGHRFYQSLLGIHRRPGRMSPLEKADCRPECRVLADLRPISRSRPVVPLETVKFNSHGLIGGRQWAAPSRSDIACQIESELIQPMRPNLAPIVRAPRLNRALSRALSQLIQIIRPR